MVAVADDTDPDPSFDADATEAALELLANRTRLRIVDALGKRRTEAPQSPAVGFAELQRLAATEDSGNFAYPLDRLREPFPSEERPRRLPRGGITGYCVSQSRGWSSSSHLLLACVL